MMARASRAPVYEYLYQHDGSLSYLDFQIEPKWKFQAKVSGEKASVFGIENWTKVQDYATIEPRRDWYSKF